MAKAVDERLNQVLEAARKIRRDAEAIMPCMTPEFWHDKMMTIGQQGPPQGEGSEAGRTAWAARMAAFAYLTVKTIEEGPGSVPSGPPDGVGGLF